MSNIPSYPGVMWQGRKSDMDEIYHLLDDFMVTLADSPTTGKLAIVLHNEDRNKWYTTRFASCCN